MLVIVGKDEYGNWQSINSATTYIWYVFVTPPFVNITNPPIGINTTGTIALVVGGSGVVNYFYSIDNAPSTNPIPSTETLIINNLYDGGHNISIWGINAAGIISTYPWNTAWIVDTTAPVIETVQTDPNTVIVSGTDIVGYKYRIDNNDWSEELDPSTPIVIS